MYKVYILKSLKNSRYYVGHSEDITNRLKRHNKGLIRSTRNGRPWELVYFEDYPTKQTAYKRELQIKSYRGGEALKRLLKK